MMNTSEMLSRGNRALVALLLKRYSQWEPADRRWLIERLRADDKAAVKKMR